MDRQASVPRHAPAAASDSGASRRLRVNWLECVLERSWQTPAFSFHKRRKTGVRRRILDPFLSSFFCREDRFAFLSR